MNTHTPGPWTVGQYTPTPAFLAIPNHSCVCDPKTKALIAVCGRADDRQSQIDADLIAAGPELLAACLSAIRLLGGAVLLFKDDDPILGPLARRFDEVRGELRVAVYHATGDEDGGQP